MIVILQSWLKGVLLGLGVAAPFGPINVEITRRHYSVGPAAGVLVGLGACTIDAIYILLISLGLHAARPGPRLEAWLSLPSSLVLLALAGLIFRGAARAREQADKAKAAAPPVAPGAARLAKHYLVGLALTASSPLNFVFWLGIITSGVAASSSTWGPWPIVLGVVCGTVGWVLGLNLALRLFRRLVSPPVLRAIDIAGALILIGFAGWGLYRFVVIIVG